MADRGLDFSSLSSGQFEEFVYDLLRALGFQNVDWRRGANTGAGAPDQGRDIVCEDLKKERDGATYSEKWFVECKHHARAVPPEELDSLLTWANAERPAKILVVSSGFLSNPAKNHLETYFEKNRPPYRLGIWERPKLEALVAGHVGLLHKHGLLPSVMTVDNLHPLHVLYMKRPPNNSLRILFGVLDQLEPARRDQMLDFVLMEIVNPRFREPTADTNRMIDLMVDRVDYETFRSKCESLGQLVVEDFLVQAIVSAVLTRLGEMGDLSALDEKLALNRRMLEIAEARRETFPGGEKSFLDYRARQEKDIAELPDRARNFRELYEEWCEKVVRTLLVEEEPFEVPEWVKKHWPQEPTSDESRTKRVITS